MITGAISVVVASVAGCSWISLLELYSWGLRSGCWMGSLVLLYIMPNGQATFSIHPLHGSCFGYGLTAGPGGQKCCIATDFCQSEYSE